MLKACLRCKQLKPEKDFYWDKTKGKYVAKCKPCYAINHTKAMKKYTSTAKGKKAIVKATREAYKNHKEKWLARAKLRYTVQKGIIKKPIKCEVCELEKLLQGHHPDYTKPLEVIWLCSRCHADEHNYLRTLKKH